ncbi:MAG: chaperone protein ClpB, partial [Bacteroidetes bacterium]|nr:chaperone protein ClpB [Bacteroidota bacterium]
VALQLRYIQELLTQKEITLEVDDSALDWLGEEGFDPQFGARPLKRTIQKEVVNEISKMILSSQVHTGDHIKVSAKNGSLVFSTGH